MNNHQKGLVSDSFCLIRGCTLLLSRNKRGISPEQNTVPDEIEQLVSRRVDGQVLLQEWVFTEVSIDVRHIRRFLCLIEIVQQRSGAGLEERRLATPATAGTTSLGTHPRLQIQILLQQHRTRFPSPVRTNRE